MSAPRLLFVLRLFAALLSRLSIIMLLGGLGGRAWAQTSSIPDRGVRDGGSYAISDIEAISMTNGNLHLSIPLASLPPIAGGKLSWTISAVYDSKLWDTIRAEGYPRRRAASKTYLGLYPPKR